MPAWSTEISNGIPGSKLQNLACQASLENIKKSPVKIFFIKHLTVYEKPFRLQTQALSSQHQREIRFFSHPLGSFSAPKLPETFFPGAPNSFGAARHIFSALSYRRNFSSQPGASVTAVTLFLFKGNGAAQVSGEGFERVRIIAVALVLHLGVDNGV